VCLAAHTLEFHRWTPVTVKLLLPPRQSRGNSHAGLATTVLGALALGAGTARATEVVYGNFTSAGAVSNLSWLTHQGTGCTANCGGSNTVYGGPGYALDGTNDVTFNWTGTVFTANSDYTGPGGASNASLSSPRPMFGFPWTAHDVQIFAPGSYSFDASLGNISPALETGTVHMTVDANQLGMHMLLDWNGNNNIDIVNVWNLNSTFSNCAVTYSNQDGTGSNCLWAGNTNTAGNNASTVFALASTDNDGDGTLGVPVSPGGPFYDNTYGGFNFNFNLQIAAAQPVPVPAAFWPLGSGLLGLFGVARKRRNH
jgi:hypothetical protein